MRGFTTFFINDLPSTFPQRFSRTQNASYFSTRLYRQTQPSPPHSIILALVLNSNPEFLATTVPIITQLSQADSPDFTERKQIPLFGLTSDFYFTLNTIPSNNRDRQVLCRRIASVNQSIRQAYKIIPSIPVRQNVLHERRTIITMIASITDCKAMFPHFEANGKLSLVCLLVITRQTSSMSTNDIINILRLNHQSFLSDPTPLTSTYLPPNYIDSNNNNTNFTNSNTYQNDRRQSQQRPPSTQTVRMPNKVDKSGSPFRQLNVNLTKLNLNISYKSYTVLNGAGGLAIIGIYNKLNYDNQLRDYIDGIPYNKVLAFNLLSEAQQLFQAYFPNAPSTEFINNNCCSNTSNINIASPLLQEWITTSTRSNTTQREFFLFDTLPANIQQQRLAANRRRDALHLPISASYTFSPGEPNFFDGSIIPPDSDHHSTPPLNIQVINQQQRKLPTSQQHQPSLQNNNLYDDSISTIDTQSQISNNQAPKKRSRPTTLSNDNVTFINISTSLDKSATELHNYFQEMLNHLQLPHDVIAPTTTSQAYHHPKYMDEKIVQLTLFDKSYAKVINDTFGIQQHASIAFSPTRLHTSTIDDLSMGPYDLSSDFDFLPYCPFTTCPAHNNQLPYFPITDRGLEIAQLHGQQLHYDILSNLTSPNLRQVGWSRCCDSCNNIFLIQSHLSQHQQQCERYQFQLQTFLPSDSNDNMDDNTYNATTHKSKNE